MDPKGLKEYIDIQFEKEDCFVAFLDILGYKNLVEKCLNPTCDQDKKIKGNIRSALKSSLKTIESSGNPFFKPMRYKNFSDCTCYSTPTMYDTPHEATMLCNLILVVNNFTVGLMKVNIYHRGGISFGYHSQDEFMIFSEALIKAHKLEDEIAKFPRTILDEKLVQRFIKLWKRQKKTILDLGIEKKLIVDKEGIVFINPFNIAKSMDKANLEYIRSQCVSEKEYKECLYEIDNQYHIEIRDNLEKMIEEYKDDERVLPKYLWLRELLLWNMNPESSDKFEYFLK